MLPPQLLELFERVRQSADFMPTPQMAGVMSAALGATTFQCLFPSLSRGSVSVSLCRVCMSSVCLSPSLHASICLSVSLTVSNFSVCLSLAVYLSVSLSPD